MVPCDESGSPGQDLFLDKADRDTFLSLLKETATMFNLKVSAYCLMQTHHLLVQTPDANLSRDEGQVSV
jgi:putative transposase